MLKISGDRPSLTVCKEFLRIKGHSFKIVNEFLHKSMS